MNRRFRGLIAALACGAIAMLSACGGGRGEAQGGAGGATPAAQYEGTVTGFGSVIVNGVRFDERSATVTVDDEPAAASALRLGMRASVTGTVSEDGTTGSATSVTVETGVRGAVASVDPASLRLRIRNITVQTDAQTVFEGAADLAGVTVGAWVEVHGTVDFENRVVQATRVEVKPPEEVGRVVLFGNATDVTPTTFRLGDLTVDRSAALLIGFDGGTIAEGALVRVRSAAAPVGATLVATVVKAVKAPRLVDATPAAVEGRIQRFVSAADFQVSGTPVDASGAAFVNGVAGDLSEGKRVVVRGTLSNGRIVAQSLRFFRPDQDGEVRLIGLVGDFVGLDSFRLRGVAVDASAATFVGGSAADLAAGRLVEVKGASVGAVVQATQVTFRDANLDGALLAGVVGEVQSEQAFTVRGQPVTLAAGVRYVNGNAGSIVEGATLWMKGRRDAQGVFVAGLIIVVPNWVVASTQVAGSVTDPDPQAGTFALNGSTVRTSDATRFIRGGADDLVAGKWVVVTGRVRNGALAAETIVFPAERDETCRVFKVDAMVYDFVSPGDFKLYGFQVDASEASFIGGAAGDLANGKVVRACGDSLPDGTLLKPTQIEFLGPR